MSRPCEKNKPMRIVGSIPTMRQLKPRPESKARNGTWQATGARDDLPPVPSMTTALDDGAAWARVTQGDPDGLAALYDRYASHMFNLAMRLLKNQRDAEDLLHDVFMEAWQKADQYDPGRGSIGGWLLLLTRSRAIDRIRSSATARKHALAQEQWLEALLGSSDEHAVFVDGGLARRALEELKPAQRMVVELGYFQGLSCSEIADRCQIPLGTVKSRMSAGLAALRNQLTRPGASEL